MKRLLDITFSLIFTIFLLPVWLLFTIRLSQQKSIVKATKKVGKNGSFFAIYIFRKIKKKWLKRSLTVLNILKGNALCQDTVLILINP